MPRLYRLLAALALGLQAAAPTQAQLPVVRAVLFYSPACPHCHRVVRQILPPLMDRFGAQLQIVGVDVTTPAGESLYRAAITRLAVPEDRLGVPTLIIGDAVLVGSAEIPEQLPGLVERGLARGGVDWPHIPGLAQALPDLPPESAVEALLGGRLAGNPATPQPVPSPLERFQRDPVANSLAVAVLIGMLFSLAGVLLRLRVRPAPRPSAVPAWVFPALAALGLLIALYLGYVEARGARLACGPVGDCNAVQQSEYAFLFGAIPLGYAGAAGYAAILAAWGVARASVSPTADHAATALFALTFAGTLASAYLTFLEPFVIGATCAWCLASAMIMTALMGLASPRAHLTGLKDLSGVSARM